MTEADILAAIARDDFRMSALKAAAQLALPDWMIGAGFVRNLVWDVLHGYATPTPLADIDVIYFDPNDLSEVREEDYQVQLRELFDAPWSVTNQARMHKEHQDPPYTSSTQALSKWVETATCVAVMLDATGQLKLIAPVGIDDLVNLIVRPNGHYAQDRQVFDNRIKEKGWLARWPRLNVVT